MFKKKTCKKCGKKLSDSYDFCPICGTRANKKSEDMGMLGSSDSADEFNPFANSLFGGMSSKVLGRMLNTTMRMLEKEMQKEMKNQRDNPKTHMELFINGKRIPLNQNQNKPQVKKQSPVRKIPHTNFSNKNLKKISTLPKEEPKTNIKRIENKIIYEIEMPGVQSTENISIIKLENSIEIKALAKDKVYFKLIPINLPITNYNLSKGKLVLELGEKN